MFAQKNVESTRNRKAKTTTSVAPKQQTQRKRTASKQKPAAQPRQSFVSDPSGYEMANGYVDLGLSVKWATVNVFGYYAWGETRTKDYYSWDTYFDTNNNGSVFITFFKYDSNKKTTLDLSDDVAHVKWGGSWRMPTRAEWDELHENCTWTWTTSPDGANGCKVTSKRNGKSIFLPASGFIYEGKFCYVGVDGNYWSSSIDEPITIDSDGYNGLSASRYYGQTVRAVCP